MSTLYTGRPQRRVLCGRKHANVYELSYLIWRKQHGLPMLCDVYEATSLKCHSLPGLVSPPPNKNPAYGPARILVCERLLIWRALDSAGGFSDEGTIYGAKTTLTY